MKTHTYDNGITLTLAERFALDAVELHRSRLHNTARERVSDGSYAEFGPLSVQDIEDAADEARELVRGACVSAPAGSSTIYEAVLGQVTRDLRFDNVELRS